MSFDVLHRSLNVLESRFLEASAGTGKTFAIEQLVCRLLLESDFTIDQILVVTFTRAATRELKQRIRATLEKTVALLKTHSAPHDYLQAILEKAEAEEAIRKIEQALFCFDQAQIFTIHGFCHRMLTEFAFEAEVGLTLSDPDSRDYCGLLRQSIRDFLRTGLKPSLYSPRQIEKVLKRHLNAIDQLEEKLCRVVEQGGKIADFPDFSSALKQFNEALLQIPRVQKEPFLADFRALISCYKKMTGEEIFVQVNQLADLLEKGECHEDAFDQLLKEKEFFLDAMQPANLKVRAQPPKTLHYPGLLEQLQRTLLPLLLDAGNPVKIFARMAKECSGRWQQQLEKQEIVTPDAILKKMESSLERPAFVQKVQERYRAAIVDEFQDTDPVQWAIFQRLFLGHALLYLVGDPKQSIYAFRDADVYTYLQAADALGPERRAHLDTNYRSEPALVHALNMLFSSPGWMHLPALNRALSVPAVKWRPGAQDSELKGGRGSLHFFLAEGHTGREKSWPTASLEAERLLPFLSQEIQSIGDNFSQFAVLVKDRYQAERVQQHLKAEGIPSSVKRSASLAESTALSLVRELLDAILHPSDSSKLKRVLAGLLVCCSHLDLEQERKGAFLQLRDLLREKGFGLCLEEFLSLPWGSKGETLREQLLSTQDIQLYQDLQQIAEILIEEELKSRSSGERLLRFLQELPNEEEELLKRRQPEDGEAVTIMTTHMSKGLEFEIVFVLGVASRLTKREELVRVQKEGSLQLELFNLEKPECLAWLHEQEAEKMRQFYVALTRAKKRVYLPIVLDLDERPVDLGLASPMELFLNHLGASPLNRASILAVLERLQTQASITYSDCSASSCLRKEEDSSPPLIPPAEVKIHAPAQQILSFTSMSNPSHAAAEPIPEGVLPAGAETGTLLHRIFELLIAEQLYAPLDLQAISQLIVRETAKTLLEPWQKEIFELVQKTLHLPLAENFTLLDLNPARVQQEMEFLFTLPDGSLVKGFIDLVFEKDGKVYLLDWKSNWLESYTQEKLEAAMQAHDYFLQAKLYSSALERYYKHFRSEPFETYFGGALYVFLRGPALFNTFGVG